MVPLFCYEGKIITIISTTYLGLQLNYKEELDCFLGRYYPGFYCLTHIRLLGLRNRILKPSHILLLQEVVFLGTCNTISFAIPTNDSLKLRNYNDYKKSIQNNFRMCYNVSMLKLNTFSLQPSTRQDIVLEIV